MKCCFCVDEGVHFIPSSLSKLPKAVEEGVSGGITSAIKSPPVVMVGYLM